MEMRAGRPWTATVVPFLSVSICGQTPRSSKTARSLQLTSSKAGAASRASENASLPKAQEGT